MNRCPHTASMIVRTIRVVLLAIAGLAVSASAAPLRVCATVPDLGDLARTIGGEDVEVTVFASGRQDPHFILAKPSFISRLSRADVFIQIGLELETGWAPVLLDNARNRNVLPGAPGFIDASTAIEPLEVVTGRIDRSMGDVHGLGNPHYLLDPENGRKVAALLRDRFSALRPERADAFRARYDVFSDDLSRRLAAWQDTLAPYRGSKVVGDHNMWPYFARRFGFDFIGFLEPKPGAAPTTRHLGDLVARMKTEQAKLIVSAPYFDPRHGRFVSEHTGVPVVLLAHQVDALPAATNYPALFDANIAALRAALDR